MNGGITHWTGFLRKATEMGKRDYDRPNFRAMGYENDLSYEVKVCPKCKKERTQVVGYNPQDESLEILHLCCGCGNISAYWEEHPTT